MSGPRGRIGTLVTTAALPALAFLLTAAGCGGTPESDDGSASEPAAEAPAERTGPGTAGGAAGGTTAAAGGAETHSHDGEGAHTHGGDTHTHASADTLDANIPLASAGAQTAPGTVTVLARGDTLRVHVSLEGAEPETRHSARLVAGSCSEPGDLLAELTPVMTGRSGKGSSQTELSPSRTAEHAHGAVQVADASGSPVGCASVHLAGAHEHDGS